MADDIVEQVRDDLLGLSDEVFERKYRRWTIGGQPATKERVWRLWETPVETIQCRTTPRTTPPTSSG